MQRDATDDKESNIPEVKGATSLVAKTERPAADNDRSLKLERMLLAKGHREINSVRKNTALLLRHGAGVTTRFGGCASGTFARRHSGTNL